LVGLTPAHGCIAECSPRLEKGGPIEGWCIAFEEFAVALDATGDHRFASLDEDRSALWRVRLEQPGATPALQHRRQFPTQVDHVLESRIQSEATIWRMAVARIAGDERASDLIRAGDRNPQVPEPHVVEVRGELEAGGLVEQAQKIVVVGP